LGVQKTRYSGTIYSIGRIHGILKGNYLSLVVIKVF